MKTTAATLFCAALFVTASFAHADVVDYRLTNGSLDSLQISQSDTWDNKSLATLFNTYFTEQLGGFEYGTSQELFDDRGVNVDVANWSVHEGAKIVSSFKNAAYGHTLSLVDSTGTTVDSTTFASWTFQDNLGSETIFNMAAGEYNFTLETWLSGPSSVVETFYGSDPELNSDNLYHMVAFDVTDLIRIMFNDDSITSAYLFGWEDMTTNSDWDYQDLAYVMINVVPNATPEPATALIFGLGALVLPFARRRFQARK